MQAPQRTRGMCAPADLFVIVTIFYYNYIIIIIITCLGIARTRPLSVQIFGARFSGAISLCLYAHLRQMAYSNKTDALNADMTSLYTSEPEMIPERAFTSPSSPKHPPTATR